jgi:hypothetical protein
MKSIFTVGACMALFLVSISMTRAASNEDDRWMSRRDIKTIRAIYREIETSIEKSVLKKTRASEDCFSEQSALTEAYLITNSQGKVRKLFVAYGTEDSLGSMAYYYDVDGALRFTLQSVGAVNGTRQERRIYFDRTGKELHSNDRILAGPGYNYVMERYVPWPEAYLKSLCE